MENDVCPLTEGSKIAFEIKTTTNYCQRDHSSFIARLRYDTSDKVQWNPVNTDTKGTCQSVRIIAVSVLSGLSDKKSGTHVLSKQRISQTFFRQQNVVLIVQ